MEKLRWRLRGGGKLPVHVRTAPSVLLVSSIVISLICTIILGLQSAVSVHQTLLLQHASSTSASASAGTTPQQTSYDESVDFWITKHLRWHDVNRYNVATRRIIFRTIGAGLGDHIKALVTAYSYAVLTRRILVVDWSAPYPIASVLSKRAIRRFVYRAEVDGLGDKGHHFNFKYGHGLPPRMVRLLASDVRSVVLKMGPAQSVNSITDELRGSRWIDVSIPKFNWPARRMATRIILEPSEELSNEVRDLQALYGLCSHGAMCVAPHPVVRYVRAALMGGTASPPKHYFAVHARLGVGTGETHFSRFSSTMGNEARLARCFAESVARYAQDASPVVFVASDTASWRPLFRRVMLEHLPGAQVVHLNDMPGHWRSIPHRSRRGRRIFIRQHVEMLLIGDATRVIAFSSGFSEVGFWRGSGRHFTRLERKQCLEQHAAVV